MICTCTLYHTVGVEILKQYQARYAVMEQQRQELTNAEKLFDLPITMYPGMVELDRNLKNLTKVYDIYEAQKVRPKHYIAVVPL